LAKYPRNFERDKALCEKTGADVIFFPEASSMYGKHYQTSVDLEALPRHLCGLSRPTHFRGVATVVAKLFNLVRPHAAVFGEKDFQQLAVIRRMVEDLDFPVRIIGVPTKRENDGLAMSSRNAYLSKAQRENAPVLYKSLLRAADAVARGERDAAKIAGDARELILSRPETEIDYVAICDPETLDDVAVIKGPVLMALAVRVGTTRLIDNMILAPAG
jgi:pantoate--beta-alanine ligase